MQTVKRLHIVLIKPSKYDDDGFVIRYFRGVLPSNTLAAMRSLTLSFADKWRRERGISITIDILDDIVDAIPYARIARKNRGATKVVAALVGVQTNQYVRASDIARRLTEKGVTVILGGFHVSGVLALFEEPTSEIRDLMDAGVIIVEGEAELVWEDILADVAADREKLLYRKSELPDISSAPVPQMGRKYLRKFAVKSWATIDCSRGCPFNCSFCTIINVQGRKMRCRSAENVLSVIRKNFAAGIKEYFFTDDNFSRNPAWEAMFDGLIHLREAEGHNDLTFMMQVDTQCHKILRFIEKASRAGCSQVFIGMESINQENLTAVGKTQNNVRDYERFIKAWHDAGVVAHVGYMIGFPFDTTESVKKDIETLKDVLKVDQASFFILTPLPGSRDHYDLVQNGEYMDSDLNKFDSFHVVMNHRGMSADEVFAAYQDAWSSFYDLEHLKKVLIRAGRREYWGIFRNIMWYKNSLLEPRHPMVAGFVRLKNRKDIRSGVPRMGFRAYHRMRIRELLGGFVKRIGLFFELQELWWMTRKPDDPKFKLIADFSTALADAKFRLSTLDLNGSYAKWCDEAASVMQSAKVRIGGFSNPSALKGGAQKRFNHLVEETGRFFERLNPSELASRGGGNVSGFLTQIIRQAEELSLRNVARRRRITHFWVVTWERIRTRKIIRFTLSIPRIFLSAARDLPMSLWFAFHLKKHF